MKKLFGYDDNTAKPRASEKRTISLDIYANHHCISTVDNLSQLPKVDPKPGDWCVISFETPNKFLDDASTPYWDELNKPHNKYRIHKLCIVKSPEQARETIIQKINNCQHIDEISIEGFIDGIDVKMIKALGQSIRSTGIKKVTMRCFTKSNTPEEMSALFEGLSGSQSILSLDLTLTYLNDEAVFDAFLAMVKTLPNLKILTLCGSAIQKESLPKLSQVLPTLKQLIQLDLRENQSLSAKDCYALAISIPSLKELGSDDTYTLRRLNRASKCDIQFFDENLFEKAQLGLTYLDFDLPNSKPEGPQNK